MLILTCICLTCMFLTEINCQGLSVKLVAGTDESTSSVVATGSVQHETTLDERKQFGFASDTDVKNIIKEYTKEASLVPDAVYINVVDGMNLHLKNQWPVVKTVFKAVGSEILGITSEPSIVSQKSFENLSDDSINYDCSISEIVENTIESNWDKSFSSTKGSSSEVTISLTAEYMGIGVSAGMSASESTSTSLTFSEGGSKSFSTTISSSQSATFSLQPNSTKTVVLSASRGSMRLRVNYTVSLEGTVIAYYNTLYKGQNAWNFSIAEVLSKTGRPSSLQVSNDMSIGYYSNGYSSVVDGSKRSILWTEREESSGLTWLSGTYCDYPRNDLQIVPLKSKELCHHRCVSNNDCTGWIYNPTELKCILKNDFVSKYQASAYYYGSTEIVSCGILNKPKTFETYGVHCTFEGNTISTTGNLANRVECQNLCNSSAECTSWTFKMLSTTGGTCSLKNRYVNFKQSKFSQGEYCGLKLNTLIWDGDYGINCALPDDANTTVQTKNTANFLDCEQACLNEPLCITAVFRFTDAYESGTCSLRSSAKTGAILSNGAYCISRNGNLIWRENFINGYKVGINCNLPTGYSVSSKTVYSSFECSIECSKSSECSSWVYFNNMCSINYLYTNAFQASRNSSYICGIKNDQITWYNNIGANCDFLDFSLRSEAILLTTIDCQTRCVNDAECTAFTFQHVEAGQGRCQLKSYFVAQSQDVLNVGMNCGLIS